MLFSLDIWTCSFVPFICVHSSFLSFRSWKKEPKACVVPVYSSFAFYAFSKPFLGARTLLGAPGRTTRSKDATSSRFVDVSFSAYLLHLPGEHGPKRPIGLNQTAVPTQTLNSLNSKNIVMVFDLFSFFSGFSPWSYLLT